MTTQDLPDNGLPKRGEFIVRGGLVMTLDPALGTIGRGDVHVRDGNILDVATSDPARREDSAIRTLDAQGMIVIPGFVETHWHLWNAIYRNLVTVQGQYLPVKHELAPFHEPADFYHSTRLGMLEALNAGITTVHDFAHNVVDPEFADAEISAMVESGLRGRYSYGWPDALPNDQVMPLDDIERVQQLWSPTTGNHEGRLTLGLVARGPQYTEAPIWKRELGRGRELGLPIAIHAGPFAKPVSATELHEAGLLDENTMLIQFQRATEADQHVMRETGAWNSIGALLLHLRGPIEADIQNLVRMVSGGVPTCLSIDSTPISTVNMFEAMRSLWQLGVPASSAGSHGSAGHGMHNPGGSAGHGGHDPAGSSGHHPGQGSDQVAPISLRKCLEMATIDGARALGLGDRTGSLTPGKRADIVMIRATDINMVPAGDPEVALVCSGTIANVDTVISDGRILKAGGQIVGLDADMIKEEASRSLFNIRTRAGGRWAPGLQTGT